MENTITNNQSNLYEVTISYLRSEKYSGVLEGTSEDDIREQVTKTAKAQGLLRPVVETIKIIPENEVNGDNQGEQLLDPEDFNTNGNTIN